MTVTNAYTVTALLFLAVIAGCGGSREAVKSAQPETAGDHNLINLRDINSSEDDFAPFILPNGKYIVFTTNRAASESSEKIDDKSKFGEKIYKAEGGGPYWYNPTLYSEALEKARNYGEYHLAPGGKQLFFSSAYMEPNVGGSDIYAMERTVGQWGTPMSVFIVNTEWWEAHPALNAGGNTLAFSSNRQAAAPDVSVTGYFAPDLWYSDRDADGNWASPKRFPEPVNSEYAEISPYYSADGYLYFATNRYDDQGYDIVRSRRTATGWSEPERLPPPINSQSDDVFPFILEDNKAVYFASDRPGGEGGLDLYRSDFPIHIRLEGTVTVEGNDNQFIPAPNTRVTITNETADSIFSVLSDEDGKYRAVLHPGNVYSVGTGSAECFEPVPDKRVDVGRPPAFDTAFVRNFRMQRVVFPHFKLGRYNIPFFVTGYYYPNTNENLNHLDQRIANGELGPFEGGTTPYIDRKDEDYHSYANRIEQIFDTIYTSITEKYLSMFSDCALQDEKLLIEVRGYVDPRGLATGIYPDKTVTTKTMTIRKGEEMSGQSGNLKLANLRAYYTMEMIDSELKSRSPRYRQLRDEERIVLRAYGEGIDTETPGDKMQDPAKRRIDIELEIIGGD